MMTTDQEVEEAASDELTQEELQTLTLFVIALQEEMLMIILWIASTDDEDEDDPTLVRHTLLEMRGFVNRTCGVSNIADIWKAAPALYPLVVAASHIPDIDKDLLPEEFIPSEQTVRKCLRRYFAELKTKASSGS